MEDDRPPNATLRKLLMLKKYSTLILSILGAIMGVGFTLLLNSQTHITEMPRRFEFLYLLGFPGMLFLRVLQLIVIPLVMVSISYAVGNMDVGTSGVLGLKAAMYFAGTTLIAATIGISLSALILTPARVGNIGDMREARQKFELEIQEYFKNTDAMPYIDVTQKPNPNFYTLLDTLRNLFPTSLIGAFVYQEKLPSPINFGKAYSSQIQRTNNPNILGLICVAIFGGALLAKVGKTPQGQVLLTILKGLNMMMAVVTGWMIKLTPIGVMSLIMDNVLGSVQKLENLGLGIIYYIATTLSALCIQLFITLHLVYFIFTRKNPFKFFKGVLEAFITALATASSSATLPLLMHCLETNNGVDERISSFVTSIGATVNMNGTACYEAVAAIFLATMSLPRALSIGDYIIISVASTMAGVGTAGVPSSGLVMMIIVLDSIGVDPRMMGFVMPLDVILDRMRTSVNVMGNAFGAGIINHIMRNKLEQMDDGAKAEKSDSDQESKDEEEEEAGDAGKTEEGKA